MRAVERFLLIGALKEAGKELVRHHLESNDEHRERVLSWRELRLEAEEDKKKASFKLSLGKFALEHAPTGIWVYGVGDAILLGEGLTKHELGTGRKLDKIDAWASVIIGGIPGLPSVPTRGLFRAGREFLEETAYETNLKLQGIDPKELEVSRKGWWRSRVDEVRAAGRLIAVPPMF